MKDQTRSAIQLIEALTERAKELTCLYAIEELLKDSEASIGEVCQKIVEAIPPGWQFSEHCRARITLGNRDYVSADFQESPWVLSAGIADQEAVVGSIEVYYAQEMPPADFGPFLSEEKKLIGTIADRISHFVVYKGMQKLFRERQTAQDELTDSRKRDWEAVLDLLRQTNKILFSRVASRMLNHLCWSGFEDAEELRLLASPVDRQYEYSLNGDLSQEQSDQPLDLSTELTERIFRLADRHLSGDEILARIHLWIQEDRLSDLKRFVHRNVTLAEIAEALRRYTGGAYEGATDLHPISRGLRVSLIQRILSNQLDYINVAKEYLDITDLQDVLKGVILDANSHGMLGGKAANLILAGKILKESPDRSGLLSTIRIPEARYIPSDMIIQFMHYNSIDEIIAQKYKGSEKVRLEYPHVLQTFSQCIYPPEMVKSLSVILDEFGERPLIVRSSSLLEGHASLTLQGKYKSVFVANQGSKQDRFKGLTRAIAEVYASMFSVEPIEFRTRHGLLDFREEMGILIQEAVGVRVGSYFFPICAAVARSRNDCRWSTRLERSDGLVRLVPGIGAELAEERSGAHSVWFAPGQPAIRATRTVAGARRYAPDTIDVIDLDSNSVETLDLEPFVSQHGAALPNLELLFSVLQGEELAPPEKQALDFDSDTLVVTFDGLISRSPFALQVRALLRALEEALGVPVEIELACDGQHCYLLQCRPQMHAEDALPPRIPDGVPEEETLFLSSSGVPSGRLAEITHLVYVDPVAYGALERDEDRRAVKTAIARLGEILPKRHYALMVPRLCVGSEEADGRLGFEDVRGAAILIELVGAAGGAGMDVPIGTHFLQDLVAAGIRYLPLHLGGEGAHLDQSFLKEKDNLLGKLLPDHTSLAETIRLIDIPEVTGGKVLQVLMNPDAGRAIGVFSERQVLLGEPGEDEPRDQGSGDNYWRWRYRMAEKIAACIERDRFGVVGFYLFGSTNNGTAGPGSDIDILVHFRGDAKQREQLTSWFEGWSICLDEVNYLKTGYRSGGLLDVHLVTDEDIASRTSYAAKIGAATDTARPLEMGPLQQSSPAPDSGGSIE